ncbi:EscF/YscF/HrpA family type III secretion system needle major subunit [Providencia sp. PROV202]|uniref:EscF/YscF/HrpA family type III secretion system needle major subunit n=1 Tax=Providencia sp. PROV202 TaxID=2949902 RepID=UPI002349EB4B|nr:EscF/YscF/HrpA family type III secretion system needle major subunit [Providencia sp. PROV202]
MATPGISNTEGNWDASALEQESTTVTDNKWGMMYRTSAGISERTKTIADELKSMIDNPNLEVDNPLVLGKITALSGNYNMARQLQSNVMKSIKDAAQAIIRNV